jgi:hypothetical protein
MPLIPSLFLKAYLLCWLRAWNWINAQLIVTSCLNEFVKSFAGKPYREILKQIYADSLTTLNERDIDALVAEEEKRAIERLSTEAKATKGTPEVLSY